jgi:hypothetical protein
MMITRIVRFRYCIYRITQPPMVRGVGENQKMPITLDFDVVVLERSRKTWKGATQ